MTSMTNVIILSSLIIMFIALVSSVPMQQEEPSDTVDADGRRKYKTVCYFTNWGAHRELNESRLFPEDIPPDLCTHILYAFASLAGTSLRNSISNDISDYAGQKPLFPRIVKLKERNPNLKILISMGGWGKAGDFDSIVRSEEARLQFSENAIAFCRQHGFDGVDLDWFVSEFPTGEHKKNFGLLAKTMREVFTKESKKSGKPRLLASIATAAGAYLLTQGYDVPMLCKYLDMVNIMTYDLYGGWYNKVGHHSALYGAPGETGQDKELNTNSSVYNWLERGCSRDKLSIGIPTYGRSFFGSDPIKSWGEGGGGTGGIYSKYIGEAGVQTYYEVCLKLQKSGYERHWHPVHQSSIAINKKDSIWIGFDDPDAVRVKCEYVKREGLGGAMFWTLDMDDFKGTFCKNGSFPVIRTVKNCFDEGPLTTTTTTTTQLTPISRNLHNASEPVDDYDDDEDDDDGDNLLFNSSTSLYHHQSIIKQSFLILIAVLIIKSCFFLI